MVTGTLRQLEQMVSEQQAAYAPQAGPRHRWSLGGALLGNLTFPPLLSVTGISAVCAAGPQLAEPGR